jgi:hypothetical protein
MKQFAVLQQLATTGRSMVLADAETAAEALQLARQYVQKGKPNVRIGDNEASEHFDIETFAARHGLR